MTMSRTTPTDGAGAVSGAPFYDGPEGTGAPRLGGVIDPRRLMRRWRTLAAVVGFALAVGAGYIWIARPVYRAACLIELSVRRPRILTQQPAVIEDTTGGQQSSEIFNTQLEKFKGRAMAREALERLDKKLPHAFYPPEVGAQDATRVGEKRVKRFEAALKLALIRRSRLIEVAFEHEDPALAAVACDAFAETVESSALDANRATSDAAVAWLEAQAAAQRKELQSCEQALLEFRQKNSLDVIESRRATVADALREFTLNLAQIEGREALQRTVVAQLDGLDLNPERAGELPSDIPRGEDIRRALEQWRLAVLEREGLLAHFTPKHPEVQAKDLAIRLRRDQSLQMLEGSRVAARLNHALLKEQADSLRRKRDEQIQLAAQLESAVVEIRTRLTSLERARDAADQTFRGILTRIQDARMAADENTATVKIVERATRPDKPVRPRLMRVMALAFVLGLAGGIGLIAVSDWLDDRVAGPEDFAGYGVPVLAVVPHVKGADRSIVATATIRQTFSIIVEAFAGLAAMLDSPRHKERSKAILIASSIPSEGKTVTSCNLAATLAKKGRRVLLVDFDMRRPRLAGIFPMPAGHPDLLQALRAGGVAFEKLPYAVADCPLLDVIASRPATQVNPADTLGAPWAGALLAWAREHYDHIVLDAPPLGLVSDTLTLAPLTDCTLVMVRAETSRKRLTWHTLQRLRESGIHELALVVNDLDLTRRLANLYSPYYHYGRHYRHYANPGAEPS